MPKDAGKIALIAAIVTVAIIYLNNNDMLGEFLKPKVKTPTETSKG